MKSNPVKVNGKLFRYDFDRSAVEYIIKADAEIIREENEWKQKHGFSLFSIDAKGYIVLAYAGLNVANWKDAAARREYLTEWANDLEAAENCMAADFIKNELPYLKEEAE